MDEIAESRRSWAKAPFILRRLMYELKPVPFKRGKTDAVAGA
jgi:hypothetical protein